MPAIFLDSVPIEISIILTPLVTTNAILEPKNGTFSSEYVALKTWHFSPQFRPFTRWHANTREQSTIGEDETDGFALTPLHAPHWRLQKHRHFDTAKVRFNWLFVVPCCNLASFDCSRLSSSSLFWSMNRSGFAVPILLLPSLLLLT